MSPLTSTGEIELAPAADDLKAVIEEDLQGLLEAEGAWFIIDKGQHNDAECGLQRGVLEQFRQHLARVGRAAQFDHESESLPVRFVTQIAETFYFACLGHGCDAFNQIDFVHLIGELAHNDAAAPASHIFEVDFSSDYDLAASDGIGREQGVFILSFAFRTIDKPASREIRSLNELHEIMDADISQLVPVVEHEDQRVTDLAQVMRRDIGGHTHCDPRGSVDQQIGQSGRQDRRLGK